MPHIYDFDHKRTYIYIPTLSNEPYMCREFSEQFKNVESRYFHEGRILNTSLTFQQQIESAFRAIGFENLLTINEQICPRFILDFFCEVDLVQNEDHSFSLWFWIQEYKFLLPLEQFAQILGLPNLGQYAYSEKFSLDSLSVEENGPYHSYVPSPQELISVLCNLSEIQNPNRIRIVELRYFLQPMAVILRENVLSLVGNHEYLPASCAHMLYCIVLRQPYNLTYFFAKRFMSKTKETN